MSQSYKTLKENFVSNLSGGSIGEINCVTAVAPAAYLLWSALQSRKGFFEYYGAAAYLADFLLNVVAFLLATTLYSSNAILLNTLLISPALVLYLVSSPLTLQKKIRRIPSIQNYTTKTENNEFDALPVRPFITAYRGAMMISTCVAILAVDFRIFPRRFAKVENWGTSLMDMGVGSFVFSAGLVSARPILSARLAGRSSSFGASLGAAFRASAPLLVLGFIRLYSVKGLDYAEHVTEYGVHWNFFFTLALLPPFVALFQSFSAMMPYTALLSQVISVIYQASLEFTRLKAYILTAPRLDLLSQNREGIFSFWGYLAIFLAGQALGFDILPRNVLGQTTTSSGIQQRKRLVQRLIIWSIGWVLLFVFMTSYKYGLGLQVSRRLANFPYILWVAAFNCAQILLFCLVETLFFPGVYVAPDKATERREIDRATSRVFKSFSRNGLAIFLLANLLTGSVNLTLDTLTVGRIEAMGVLLLYLGTLTTIALALNSWDLSIKL